MDMPETIEENGAVRALFEFAAKSVPDIDHVAFGALCSDVNRLALQLPETKLNATELDTVREIMRTFGRYHKSAEYEVSERLAGWRSLTVRLLTNLVTKSGMDPSSAEAAPLAHALSSILSSEEIQAFHIQLDDFLRLHGGADTMSSTALPAPAVGPSTTDLDAAGRRGAAAVAKFKNIVEQGGEGFVALFHLRYLKTIEGRYGAQVVQDCVMAISAFLSRNLRNDDTVYAWGPFALLAILQSPATEQTMSAALQRIVDGNREVTVRCGDRNVMLRVPLSFRMFPFKKFGAAEELLDLPVHQN